MGCLGFIGYFIRVGSCGGAILNNPNAGECKNPESYFGRFRIFGSSEILGSPHKTLTL